MSKLSIKGKITLWYAVFMIAVVAVVFALIFYITDSIVENNLRSTVERRIAAAAEDLEMENGVLQLDDDVPVYSEGVYLSVYDESYGLMFGKTPPDFSFTEFKDGEYRKTEELVVLDTLTYIAGYGNLWIRAVAPVDTGEDVTGSAAEAILLMLPLLVIIAATGGYLITKRAFAPVEKIRLSAQEINGSGDLSKRIALGEGADEIHLLAQTFDEMLGRIEAAFESEKQFTSDASHELRTPVTVIISQCEYALESGQDNGKQTEALESILLQAKKMSSLISQLLTLARADKGQSKLMPETVNISELCEVVAEQQREVAAKRSISVSAEVGNNILITADETLIMRLLINLIGNAVKFGKEGGFIRLGLKDLTDSVEITVEDNGIGIDEQELEKIFNRFYQSEQSRTASEDNGMGLGLSMVKWIAEAHGGSISVESTLGAGTAFTVRLPK